MAKRLGILGTAGVVAVAVGTVLQPVEAQVSGTRVLGHNNLGGTGANASVAVVGNTAIVGAGFQPSSAGHAAFYNPINCPPVTVKVVDIANSANPTVVATIPVPPGQSAIDVDALQVNTPSFTGALAAVAFQACNSTGNFNHRGVQFYSLNNPSQPVLLGHWLPDSTDPRFPPCGPTAANNCASSVHEIAMAQRPDGRVIGLASLPFFGNDLRIVDVTNPAAPTQVATYPPSPLPTFSTNGCRPFNAIHSAEPSPSGTQALAAALDFGVLNLNLANPAAPSQIGRFAYPPTRTVEGNAGFVTYAGTSRPLGVVSEEDWVAPNSTFVVNAPGAAGGSKFACEAMFTLFDPEDNAAVYRKPNGTVMAELAYVGRGCPQSPTSTGPDPYLDNPAGKIALVDRSLQRLYQPVLPDNFCSFSDRARRAQQAGAVGIVVLNTFATPAFSPDGEPVSTGIDRIPVNLSIPEYMIETADANALRPAVCPSVQNGTCAPHRPVYGSMIDRPGEWGSLRVLDLSNPAAPTQVGSYRTLRSRQFPPPDNGVYAPARPVALGNYAYVAWNSDGLRVIDLTYPSAPREIGSFVPPDTPDPHRNQPPKALVQGIDLAGCGRVVITDVNTGLYVVAVPAPPNCASLGSPPLVAPGPEAPPPPAARPGEPAGVLPDTTG